MKHTPGPWEMSVEGRLYAYEVTALSPRGLKRTVCRVATKSGRREHDARLIAAAPTMYDYIATRASDGDKRAAEIIEVINGNA